MKVKHSCFSSLSFFLFVLEQVYIANHAFYLVFNIKEYCQSLLKLISIVTVVINRKIITVSWPLNDQFLEWHFIRHRETNQKMDGLAPAHRNLTSHISPRASAWWSLPGWGLTLEACVVWGQVLLLTQQRVAWLTCCALCSLRGSQYGTGVSESNWDVKFSRKTRMVNLWSLMVSP
jgi:hypothetical protein